jgi:hypothetical protein
MVTPTRRQYAPQSLRHLRSIGGWRAGPGDADCGLAQYVHVSSNESNVGESQISRCIRGFSGSVQFTRRTFSIVRIVASSFSARLKACFLNTA